MVILSATGYTALAALAGCATVAELTRAGRSLLELLGHKSASPLTKAQRTFHCPSASFFVDIRLGAVVKAGISALKPWKTMENKLKAS